MSNVTVITTSGRVVATVPQGASVADVLTHELVAGSYDANKTVNLNGATVDPANYATTLVGDDSSITFASAQAKHGA